MQVYERACAAVEQKDKAEVSSPFASSANLTQFCVHERTQMYQIWIARCAEFFGVTKTREIYEKALRALPDDHVKRMCVQFAGKQALLLSLARVRLVRVLI